MADNVTQAGLTFAFDDISSVFHQRIKLGLGADGTAVDAVAGAGAVGTGVQRMTLASDDVLVSKFAGEYEAVAASATDQVIGPTGASGDYLSHVIVSPATVGCGVVTIKDNATSLVAFAGGGTTPLSNLIPFVIPVGIVSTSGAWKITTGANVSCVAVGNFT